jgi:hypothetical protein
MLNGRQLAQKCACEVAVTRAFVLWLESGLTLRSSKYEDVASAAARTQHWHMLKWHEPCVILKKNWRKNVSSSK